MVRSGLSFISFVSAAALYVTGVRAEILIGVPGPITGDMAWFGEQMQEGLGMAVAELNATGGVLGQSVQLLFVDDYCDAEQAVAAAHKLVAARVNVVIGNICSGAAIPASRNLTRTPASCPSTRAPPIRSSLTRDFAPSSASSVATPSRGPWRRTTWPNAGVTRTSRSSMTARHTARASPKPRSGGSTSSA